MICQFFFTTCTFWFRFCFLCSQFGTAHTPFRRVCLQEIELVFSDFCWGFPPQQHHTNTPPPHTHPPTHRANFYGFAHVPLSSFSQLFLSEIWFGTPLTRHTCFHIAHCRVLLSPLVGFVRPEYWFTAVFFFFFFFEEFSVSPPTSYGFAYTVCVLLIFAFFAHPTSFSFGLFLQHHTPYDNILSVP